MAAYDADYSIDGDQAVTEILQRQYLSIGIGCSSRATGDDVIRLIQSSVDSIPLGTVIATLDRRASIGEHVASTLGLSLVLFPASILAGVNGTNTYSSLALAKTQSTLASLGPSARLIAPQTKGRFCTCAVAALHIRVCL